MQGIPIALLNAQIVNGTISTNSLNSDDANNRALLDLLNNLSVGDTLLGKIVSSDENSYSFLTNDNVFISAKTNEGITLEPGSTVLFEVSKNNRTDVSLRPLNINTNTEMVANSALKEAGIPIKPRSLEYTVRLMEYGMPIDKKSLSIGYRDVALNEQIPVKYVTDLQKLQIPVTKENLTVYENFQNMENSISEGFGAIVDGISQEISSAISDLMFNDFTLSEYDFDAITNSIIDLVENQELSTILSKTDGAADKGSIDRYGSMDTLDKPPAFTEKGVIDDLAKVLKPVEDKINELKKEMPITKNDNLVDLDKSALLKESIAQKLQPVLKDYTLKAIKANWTLNTENEVTKGSVRDLYERLFSDSQKLSQAFKEFLPKDSPVNASLTNLQNNIDFMDSMNQLIPYVQIPVSFNDETRNSELYVFRNGRNLSSKESEITAFVHLDTDNLGAFDVFVKMKDTNVSTNFRLEREEFIDYIEKNMDFLNKRLRDKGYSFTADVKLNEEHLSPIETMLSTFNNHVCVANTSFDARI